MDLRQISMGKLWESVVKRIGKNANTLRVLGVAFGIWLIIFSTNVNATIKIQVLSTSKMGTGLVIGFGSPDKRPFGQEVFAVEPNIQKTSQNLCKSQE